MATPMLTVLVAAPLPDAATQALVASPFGPFLVRRCADVDEALAETQQGAGIDALLLASAPDDEAYAEAVARSAEHVAILLVEPSADGAAALAWWQRGVQEVLTLPDLASSALPQRVRAAIERKRREQDVLKAHATAYATDLETGLPHQQQLIEHISQLIALRERQPSPMALLVLRIEGLATARARLGGPAAQVLRRKIAVRLRAGVRASDVVAALADDCYAVLLGAMLAAADATVVAAKLQAAMLEPFKVAGVDIAVATALGIAQYPDDGPQADALLRRASGLAASALAQGRAGHANFAEGGSAGAANDE
ncbi:MAG TPA: GGDEF domain-containing protein [Burkholderiaceae bacterium]